MTEAFKQLFLFLRGFGLNYVFFLLSLFFGAALLLPFIDNAVYRMPRLEQKARVLSELSKIDSQRLKTDPAFRQSYEQLLQDLDKYQFEYPEALRSYIGQEPSTAGIFWRFLAGSFFAILLLPIFYFAEFDKASERWVSLSLIAALGVFSGCISIWLPSFRYESLNYLLGATIQILLLITTFVKFASMNSEQQAQTAVVVHPQPPRTPPPMQRPPTAAS